jgi:hypothetical protein
VLPAIARLATCPLINLSSDFILCTADLHGRIYITWRDICIDAHNSHFCPQDVQQQGSKKRKKKKQGQQQQQQQQEGDVTPLRGPKRKKHERG